jgi:hypothetical protein
VAASELREESEDEAQGATAWGQRITADPVLAEKYRRMMRS